MSINLQKLRKFDLHVHLEGTVTVKTLTRLASKNKVDLGAPTRFGSHTIHPPAGIKDGRVSLHSFHDFIGIYVKISECIRDAEDIQLIATEYTKSCEEQNIAYSEIYFSPTTFRDLGRPLENLFEGLIAGQKVAQKHNTQFRWIFDIVRNNASDGFDTLEIALQARKRGVDVVALGLAGYEKEFPATPFSRVFAAARSEGFVTVAHAGETAGAESIRETVTALQPTRIGHGITVVEDIELMKQLAQSEIIFEVCPWSNVLLNLCTEATHPLPHMLGAGLNVVLGSDDPGIFQKTLTDNYILADSLGVDYETLASIRV